MAQKKSYRSDIIRFAFLGIALAVFFIGPHLVQSNQADDIQDTIDFVQKSKVSQHFKAEVIHQLLKDKQYAKENTSAISIASVKLPAVYWLALLIIGLGLGTPLLMKYFENKKAAS